MSGRSRHGLHVVRDGDAPAAEEIAPLRRSPGERPFVAVQQQTVVLTVAELRTASRRVRSVSAAATRHLDDVHVNRALAAGSPPGVAVPDPAGGTATSALDDRPGRGQD